jgi:hypothetical protein
MCMCVLAMCSETIIWHMFGKWISSHRDLPLKINQVLCIYTSQLLQVLLVLLLLHQSVALCITVATSVIFVQPAITTHCICLALSLLYALLVAFHCFAMQ